MWILNLPYAIMRATGDWERTRIGSACAFVVCMIMLPFFLISFALMWLFEER